MFLGNHDVGINVLTVLSELGVLCGVVAHHISNEEGIVYDSVYKYAVSIEAPVIRATPKEDLFTDFLAELKPDLIFITDYKYLLPEKIFSYPKYGSVNLHPSLLPKYRGRASVNWAILHGESEVGLTAHCVDSGMDTGGIISQIKINIAELQDIGDVLELYYPLYRKITKDVMGKCFAGNIRCMPQDHSLATSYPRRTSKDGVIDWNSNIRDIINLVRAVAKPYPGAFSFVNNRKVIIWKARINDMKNLYGESQNGEIISSAPILIKCSRGILEVLEYSSTPELVLSTGMVLGQQ